MNYEMYTEAGNRAVADALDVLVAQVEEGHVTRRQLTHYIQRLLETVYQQGHAEVYDTEPEWHIADQINLRICHPQQWQLVSRWDWW
jgi:hypothetical protein